MSYTLHVQPHPLGVVVFDDEGGRELLIEGEDCCGVGFPELAQIANTTRHIEIDEAKAQTCRLKQL